ncbi:response regulator [Amphiplicatus metriothermophilus]|uniref:Histidine kinase-, DNA gyrase B-, and HSP90-like ATPase n=1 Tax=Amphiplicatus metriothermophilus TaxID=1519374 RepID=A0A239PIU8_9PROT|nr:hybrid sensor histidine kinase/response regulator [Amphiplicatus metriothermophilus]MBB5518121.1 CheY-like chemotaxis protein [Amphiplicatus metriothermophilus]SNT67545.1 Histidine kinase-, DNA gyrase B-, and HSP90-like ATPase [Amphiplicatus metriothermophilus]
MQLFLVGVMGVVLGGAAAGAAVFALTRAYYRSRLGREAAFLRAGAHQLRAALNKVLGVTQTLALRAEALPEEQRGLVAGLSEAGGDLKAALLDVFDMVDLESGKFKIEPRVEFLPDTIRQVQQVHEKKAREKGLSLVIDVRPSATVWLVYDHARMRQCLSSLVRQCVSQTRQGEVRVTVALRDDPERRRSRRKLIDATVSDTSSGLDPAQAETYFSPERCWSNPHLMNAEGRALSLVLARKLAEAMGGGLKAASGPGGVVFRLSVAARLAKAQRLGEEGRPLSVFEQAATLVRDKTIMIVEDNEVNVKVLKAYLQRIQPKDVLVAYNGREALEQLKTAPCDLVLMDMQMPVMDGVTAARQIRRSGARWRNVPIIAVTAAAGEHERKAAKGAGVTSFLAKPVSPDQLYERIARTLSAR